MSPKQITKPKYQTQSCEKRFEKIFLLKVTDITNGASQASIFFFCKKLYQL